MVWIDRREVFNLSHFRDREETRSRAPRSYSSLASTGIRCLPPRSAVSYLSAKSIFTEKK